MLPGLAQTELFGGAGGVADAVEGTVLRVVYAQPERGFAVVRLAVEGREGAVTAVGDLASASPGETLRIEGTWEKHATYGEQLKVTRATPVVPRTDLGVERYLAGLKGLGPELARRLVEAFGQKAIEVVADEPWRAAAVRGVGKRRAQQVSDEAKARRGEREVMVFLQGHGITPAYATRIYRRWGDQAIQRVRDNPYQLARAVAGIGFFVADRIARGMGIAIDSPLRIEAAVYHSLESFSDEGHLYAPRPLLRDKACELVDVGAERIEEAIASLALQGAIVVETREDGEGIWLPALQVVEQQLARRLRLLLASAKAVPPPGPKGRAERELARLSTGQRRALEQVRGAGVAVITGGPGTGKTTVMKAAVAVWEEAKLKVVLAAPTGRAAKRLSDATGKTASTVHRLLEWGRGEGAGAGKAAPGEPMGNSSSGWGRNERAPLEADLVVVDEASMLDTPLARALAAAVPVGATLLLVGDSDQLPSVGPGQVLADLIASGVVPVARLGEIFRQEQGSRIVEVAHGVLAGEAPLATPPTQPTRNGQPAAGEGGQRAPDDFYVISVPDGATARDRIVTLCRDRIPRAFGLHPTHDIQVLTPMHRGDAGTEALNRALQEALNPVPADAPSLTRGNRAPLHVGDKVLQIRNDYERDVFNGDIGEVSAIDDEEGTAKLLFDERTVEYDRDALDLVELAYAVSVHKSQGSEYPAVVIALLPEHHMLLRRNLLYTAITRGKRLVVVVGSPRAIRRAVDTVDAERRFTRLRERLRELAPSL